MPGTLAWLGSCHAKIVVERLPCELGQLKANGPAGLPLPDIGSVNRIAVGRHVIDAQCNEVTATQFAVNGEIEKCQVARAFLQIQLGAYRPHVTGPQGRLWASDLPLIPDRSRDTGSGVGFGHGEAQPIAAMRHSPRVANHGLSGDYLSGRPALRRPSKKCSASSVRLKILSRACVPFMVHLGSILRTSLASSLASSMFPNWA